MKIDLTLLPFYLEQGRHEPQVPAIASLRIAEQHPEVFSQLL